MSNNLAFHCLFSQSFCLLAICAFLIIEGAVTALGLNGDIIGQKNVINSCLDDVRLN